MIGKKTLKHPGYQRRLVVIQTPMNLMLKAHNNDNILKF